MCNRPLQVRGRPEIYGIAAFAVGLGAIVLWLYRGQNEVRGVGIRPLDAKDAVIISAAIVLVMIVSLLRIGAFGI